MLRNSINYNVCRIRIYPKVELIYFELMNLIDLLNLGWIKRMSVSWTYLFCLIYRIIGSCISLWGRSLFYIHYSWYCFKHLFLFVTGLKSVKSNWYFSAAMHFSWLIQNMDIAYNFSTPKFCLEVGVKFTWRAVITTKHRCRGLPFPHQFVLQL